MKAVVAHSREGGVRILSFSCPVALVLISVKRSGGEEEQGTNLGHLLGWCIWLKSPSGDKMGEVIQPYLFHYRCGAFSTGCEEGSLPHTGTPLWSLV